ncbi:DUF2938 domain-containing protein [Halomonas sp. ANAO-440]|uniref:DUF2938 domain-containing protein n=1 Tax=Halomonas sp. ANAO-440 TaxID=2861360 RepID=UPI001CAA56AE|nr:DUF2938 domain-containing protein [Halomonas sp. ANAO-440]MBZ0331710.1 DUF2938 domain-containing protein [Halomonas sp. ANAO-440]
MHEVPEILLHSVAIGVGATLVMDFWGWLQKRLFHAPPLDYALVARWLGHFPQGRFRHASLMAVPPIVGERALGWVVHYAIGIVFAALLVSIWGLEWVREPTLGPALIVGVGTVVVPFFIMQPAFGIGIAGSRTSKPAIMRLKSLVAHFFFAIGLFLAAKAWALLV